LAQIFGLKKEYSFKPLEWEPPPHGALIRGGAHREPGSRLPGTRPFRRLTPKRGPALLPAGGAWRVFRHRFGMGDYQFRDCLGRWGTAGPPRQGGLVRCLPFKCGGAGGWGDRNFYPGPNKQWQRASLLCGTATKSGVVCSKTTGRKKNTNRLGIAARGLFNVHNTEVYPNGSKKT